MKCNYLGCIVIGAALVSFRTEADPWLTGPLFIPSGHVVPVGKKVWSVLFENVSSYSIYDYNSTLIPIPLALSDNILSSFVFGLAPDVDFELDLLYARNRSDATASANFGDTMMTLDFQIIEQNDSRTHPNFKVSLQQLFPTGRFDQLNPSLFGTDATGAGSYQTSLGLCFDFLSHVSEAHYLKTYASVVGTYASPTRLSGNSIYGGDSSTGGRMNPGNAIMTALAAEYTLNQNWVAGMEGMFLSQEASEFKGNIGPDPASFVPLITAHLEAQHPHAGQVIDRLSALRKHRIRPTRHNVTSSYPGIGSGNLSEISLAPILEYHFSEKVAIIGGTWFTVYGKNTPQFFSSIFVINLVL